MQYWYLGYAGIRVNRGCDPSSTQHHPYRTSSGRPGRTGLKKGTCKMQPVQTVLSLHWRRGRNNGKQGEETLIVVRTSISFPVAPARITRPHHPPYPPHVSPARITCPYHPPVSPARTTRITPHSHPPVSPPRITHRGWAPRTSQGPGPGPRPGRPGRKRRRPA